MGLAAGGFLRLFQTFLYALEFCCASIILGIYSYFLAFLSRRNLSISNQSKAVEGISGAAVLYLIFAVLLTCFLGGVSFFAFVAIVLDVLFVGGFIVIAVMTRNGANSCSGYVNTPLGNGPSNVGTPSLRLPCKLNTAAFAVSIIGAVLFLLTALVQIALVRNHKKEKRYGPSPANNYTSGSGKARFWQRKPKTTNEAYRNDAELGVVGAGAGGLVADKHNAIRPSHDTAYTGSTVAAPTNPTYGATGNKYETPVAHDGPPVLPSVHGGYYNQPEGMGMNPYGYENTTTHPTGAASNF
ncbi:hypothetical protein BJ546DRAFT_231027 [Cryomyces antarcticus]